MNWGTKIIIGMASFMTFIIILGVLMFRSETDALVEKDYYEKGLDYDKDYAQKANVIKDGAQPLIRLAEGTLDITFKTEASGTVKMMRNSDKDLDRIVNFNTNDKSVKLDLSELADGRWKTIIKWRNDAGTEYLNEQEIMIP